MFGVLLSCDITWPISVMFQVHPKLECYLKFVLDQQFGLKRRRIVVINTSSRSNINNGWINSENDEILLELPFADQQLRWQFSFDMENLDKPPDILDEDSFFENQTIDIVKEMVPSLGNWKASDPKSLLTLILELLDLYQATQIMTLKNEVRLQRCWFEYETLLAMKYHQKSDMEVAVQQSSREYTVDFFLSLKIDVSELPLPIPDSSQSLAILLATFRTQGKTSVEIHVWEELENLIGRTNIGTINGDMTLMDFVPEIEKLVQGKIDSAVSDLKKRQYLFCALVQLVEPAILDADSETCSKIAFLLKNGTVEAICSIFIPVGFPKTPPVISVLRPGSERKLPNISWCAEWPYMTMAQKILDGISESVL